MQKAEHASQGPDWLAPLMPAGGLLLRATALLVVASPLLVAVAQLLR